MVTIDKPDLDASLRRFGAGINRIIEQTHAAGKNVMRVEAGRLVQTLITVTPPDDRKALQQKIGDNVNAAFNWLEQHALYKAQSVGSLAPEGPSKGVTWYAFQSEKVFGIAADKDMRSSSAEDLYQTYFTTKVTKQGRMNVGKRGKQTFYLWQKITTKAATVKKLAARLIAHIGRQKAGWLPAWRALGSPTGIAPVPGWVLAHEQGARGDCDVSGLDNAQFPQVVFRNFAKGAGSFKLNNLITGAVAIRVKAMVENLKYLIKYPERASHYK